MGRKTNVCTVKNPWLPGWTPQGKTLHESDGYLPDLSKDESFQANAAGESICPYLLRNAVIDKPNQAWSIDITYIPIKRGFLYLTAVIDWYSRCIVGWEVDDTLDTRMVISALKKAFKVAKPQILNSDQGCQFTSQQYIDFVKENGIRQSMDGKSRWADNIMIERWFRSFKYEEAYLTQYNNIREARAAIGQYIHNYNFERRHSALDYQTPAECYYPAMLMPYVA